MEDKFVPVFFKNKTWFICKKSLNFKQAEKWKENNNILISFHYDFLPDWIRNLYVKFQIRMMIKNEQKWFFYPRLKFKMSE
jgi:hypothetical protein